MLWTCYAISHFHMCLSDHQLGEHVNSNCYMLGTIDLTTSFVLTHLILIKIFITALQMTKLRGQRVKKLFKVVQLVSSRVGNWIQAIWLRNLSLWPLFYNVSAPQAALLLLFFKPRPGFTVVIVPVSSHKVTHPSLCILHYPYLLTLLN